MKVLGNKRERGRKTTGQTERGAGVGKKQAVTLACQLLPTGRRSGSLSCLPVLWASGLKLHRSPGETAAAQRQPELLYLLSSKAHRLWSGKTKNTLLLLKSLGVHSPKAR